MISSIIISLSFTTSPLKYPNIKKIKQYTDIGSNNLKTLNIGWEKTYFCESIIDKYFKNLNFNQYHNLDNNNNNKNDNYYYYGEIFKISGYPAALVIINNKFNEMYIEEFILNKNLIMMFDAGPIMRLSFYNKFKKITINKAINKEVFLII